MLCLAALAAQLAPCPNSPKTSFLKPAEGDCLLESGEPCTKQDDKMAQRPTLSVCLASTICILPGWMALPLHSPASITDLIKD